MTNTSLIQNMQKECKELNLLYVEDDIELRKNTQEILSPFFKSIVVANDGKDGLKKYKADSFDIVLTDIVMPNIDGKDMSIKIKQIKPDQAIIIMSAYEDSDYLMELIEIGINKFIPKPPNLKQFFGSIITTAININNSKKVARISEEMKQDLHEKKVLLRTIIDTAPVRIFWKDKESRYLGCNKLFAKDAGVKDSSELIGKTDFDLPWKDEAEEEIADDKIVINNRKKSVDYEEKRVQTDIGNIWIASSKTPLKAKNLETIGVLGVYIDISDKKEALFEAQEAKNELGYQAEHDLITGLPNRVLYFDRLNQAIKKAKQEKKELAIIFLDLDRFKEINDSLNHEIGDQVIKSVGERLKQLLEPVDSIARFGGDEFVILLESMQKKDDIYKTVTKLLKSMDKPFIIDNHKLHLTFSAGISIFPNDGDNAETLIRNADTAMYGAKDEGRNNYQLYTKDMTNKSFSHMLISKNIRDALTRGEFMLYYQPQINGENGELTGMEALVRWKHPKDGFISPNEFIPIAEDSGLIDKIGDYVFNEAVAKITQWYKKGYNPGKIAINLSTIELQQSNFVEKIHKKIVALKCKPEWIELEITERYTMKHPNEAIRMLQKLRDIGITLAIDDFGTGYSSLSYLKKLPINKLKIDQSFIYELPDNSNDRAIVKAIISLANSMNFDVIAEGVETVEQKEFLIKKGCKNIQGYLYAKPMSAEDMELFLKERV